MNTFLFVALLGYLVLPTQPAPASSSFKSLDDPTVAGIFVGRTPCQELAKELHQPVAADCFKLKWKLILYQDPATRSPTTYRLEGTPYRQHVREGTWKMTTGTKTDPNATVYQLDPDQPDRSVYLLKGDDNVLFFLTNDRQVLIGNADFGYTLNRSSR